MTSEGGSGHLFPTTRWTLVVAAGENGTSNSREALAELCQRYWQPLYYYLRRRGHSTADAQDLTQGFFLQVLEKASLGAADRERGRFRSFLLASLKNYASDQRKKRLALKRAAGRAPLSLDFAEAELRYRQGPLGELSPEQLFDRHWALSQLRRVLARLREEMDLAGKGDRFVLLKGYLIGGSEEVPYKRVAEELGVGESGVKAAVRRMRRRYGELLREEIAETLADPSAVDTELRYLFESLRR